MSERLKAPVRRVKAFTFKEKPAKVIQQIIGAPIMLGAAGVGLRYLSDQPADDLLIIGLKVLCWLVIVFGFGVFVVAIVRLFILLGFGVAAVVNASRRGTLVAMISYQHAKFEAWYERTLARIGAFLGFAIVSFAYIYLASRIIGWYVSGALSSLGQSNQVIAAGSLATLVKSVDCWINAIGMQGSPVHCGWRSLY